MRKWYTINTMALDNTTLKSITDLLFKELDGAFLERPFSLSYTSFAFPYHSGGNTKNKGRGTLIIGMDPENPLLLYSYDKFTKIDDNSIFANFIKRLTGTRVRNVKKSQGERVVTISLICNDIDIESTYTHYDLVIELFPMHPNVYIIGYPGEKIISLYKEHGDISKVNYVGRGLPYIYPDPRQEVNINITGLEEIKPLLSRATYRRFSKYADSVGFARALKELVSSKDFYMVDNQLEILPYTEDAIKVELEDIFSHFVQDQRKDARLLKEKNLITVIDKALRIATKKKYNLDKDRVDATEHLIYKDYGQLLYMAQSDYVPKSTEITVEGITIPLDSKLNLPENANRYFVKYRKAKQAIITLGELSLKTADEIIYLQKKKLDVENGSPRDIQELKEELVLTGYIKEQRKKNKKKTVKKHYVPHYLELENGRIGFGLNDLQNESLTFEIAHQDALFFHVKEHPGSHVIILEGMDNNEVRATACELALFLSHLDDGEVYYTQKRYVKKNKEKRGLVNLLEFKTIIIKKIRPSSISLFKKLLKSE